MLNERLLVFDVLMTALNCYEEFVELFESKWIAVAFLQEEFIYDLRHRQ